MIVVFKHVPKDLADELVYNMPVIYDGTYLGVFSYDLTPELTEKLKPYLFKGE